MPDPIKYIKTRMVIFYHDNEPRPVPFYCSKCGNTLFVTNRELLSITNSPGIPYRQIPTSMVWIEVPCGFCKALYKVLFQ